MNNVNKTMYIPLYGKALVSKKGIILKDKKAEEIWIKEGFKLKGKSKSKYLAYYMGIRSAVFDEWVLDKIKRNDNAVILHIGCGLDGRIYRVGFIKNTWYDVDFKEVLDAKKRYFIETDNYKMLEGNAIDCEFLSKTSNGSSAIVLLEGVSMYLNFTQLRSLFDKLSERFENVSLLMDCYTDFAVKMSKYKNPVKDVGVSKVYGLNNPNLLNESGIKFIKERQMTPNKYINQLKGVEKFIFSKLYAGNISKKLYKLYEFKK